MRVDSQPRRGRALIANTVMRASAFIAATVLAQSAFGAADINFWDSGGGANQNWSFAANWNKTDGNTANVQTNDVEPVPADSAALNNGGTIIIDQLGEACSRFQLGRSNYALTVPGPPVTATANSANLGLGGTVNVLTGGQLVDSGAFDMGTYTAGGPQAPTTANFLNVSGGELDTGEFMRVGVAAGSGGTVTQTGGIVSIATNFPGSGTGQLNIGDRGTGSYTISAGSLAVLRQIVVGLNTTAVGNFNINGGTVSNTNDFVVGNEAAPVTGTNAFLNQTAGSVTTSGRYMVGFNPGASGQATHTGGTFQAGQVDVGRFGTGNLTFQGTSTLDVNSVISIAKKITATASAGTMTVSGTAVVTTGGLVVGEQGNGTLNLTGGTINVLGVTRGAGFPSSDDPFNGELLNFLVGRDGGGDVATGNGVVNHSAGTINVATNMVLGDFDDSNGVYNISGGTLAVTGNVNVGSALASNSGPSPVGTGGQAVGAKGTLHVIGNAATINIGGKFIANPADRVRTGTPNQATLAFDIGSAAGTSVINVGGVADIDGAVVNLNLSGTTYVPAYQSTYTLLTAASFGATGTAATQNTGTGSGFVLAGEDAVDWTVAVVPAAGGKQSLVATYQIVPGDTNNDKDVDFDDLVKVAQNYNAAGTRAEGDFTRNGFVNFDDLVVIAQNYGFGVTPGGLNGAALGATGDFGQDWILAQSLAPEPASLLALGAASLLMRRRRSTK